MKWLVYIFIITEIISCRTANINNGENPAKRSFRFYNENFKLDGTSKLKTGRKYWHTSRDSSGVHILVFFEDGFVNRFFTSGIDGVSGTRAESGATYGYYVTKEDSIFLTTRNYYQKKATAYSGKIVNDTLELAIAYPKNRGTKFEKYALHQP